MQPDPSRGERRITGAQWRLVGLIAALAVGRVAYDVLVRHRLQETAALFIGLPAILAVAFALTPRARSATGTILKGMTIALLLSTLFLGEGLICILLAAPIFYLVGIVIGATIDYMEDRRKGRLTKGMYGLILLPFLPLSVEGATDRLSFPRVETVIVERTVSATPADIERALARTPRLERALPHPLRVGFPRPTRATGAGLGLGDRRIIYFAGGKNAPATLVLEVSRRETRAVRFHAIADQTPIARWLDWQDADVRWSPLESGQTRVRWTLRYRRRLDPAWYFAPMERAVVRSAAGYLIDATATPHPEP
ncbi:MAG: SRPBCC family protein [bacterium]